MCLLGIAPYKIKTLTIQKAVTSVCIIYRKTYPMSCFAHTAFVWFLQEIHFS